MSKKTAKRRKRNPGEPYGTTGDRDPFTFGGGIVYLDEDGNGDWVVFPHTEEDLPDPDDYDEEDVGAYDERTGKIVGSEKTPVFWIPVGADILADHDWVKVKEIASFTGQSAKELRRMSKSPDIMERVYVLESIASHDGYANLDSSPNEMKLWELKAAFDADHDKALAAEHARMVARVEAERARNPAPANPAAPKPTATGYAAALAKRLVEGD